MPESPMQPAAAKAQIPPGAPLGDLIQSAITCFEDMGGPGAPGALTLGELRKRLHEGRFHLAVLGQFKRGKSTFVNALLGAPVLPTAVVPLTALPTFLRWGDPPQARIQFKDGRAPETLPGTSGPALEAFLQAFVTEEGNPENRKGVQQVDVWHPSPLLREGLVIIDTPGIGSTFRHNTEATLNFLPQCDAAVFLVSADPPVTEVEVAFLRQVKARMARVILVLNKVDYLDPEERHQATAFFQKILQEQLAFPPETQVLCVSSRRALQAAQDRDPAAWEASGMGQVHRLLLNFAAHEKTRALEGSIARKVMEVLEDALLRVQVTLQSLKLPVQDLESRLTLFEQKLEEIERERALAGDLLAGDRKRAHAFLEEQAESPELLTYPPRIEG